MESSCGLGSKSRNIPIISLQSNTPAWFGSIIRTLSLLKSLNEVLKWYQKKLNTCGKQRLGRRTSPFWHVSFQVSSPWHNMWMPWQGSHLYLVTNLIFLSGLMGDAVCDVAWHARQHPSSSWSAPSPASWKSISIIARPLSPSALARPQIVFEAKGLGSTNDSEEHLETGKGNQEKITMARRGVSCTVSVSRFHSVTYHSRTVRLYFFPKM